MWGYLINLFALIEKLLFLTTIVCHPQKDSFSIASDNYLPIILIARHLLNRFLYRLGLCYDKNQYD